MVAPLLGLLSAMPAAAQDMECSTVEACAQAGAELFQQSRFRDAAIVLQRAYGYDQVPVLLYNIARAYQQDNRCAAASDYFQQYLATGDTQARAQAEQHEPGETACAGEYNGLMDRAREALSAGRPGEAAQLVAQALDVSDEPEARVMRAQALVQVEDCQGAIDYVGSVEGEVDLTDAQRNQLTSVRTDAETCLSGAAACRDQQAACEQENERLTAEYEAQSGEGQQTLGLIVAGVGGAVLIGAIIHDAASQGTIDDYEDAAINGTQEEFNDLADDIDSAKTLSLILYGLGVVGVGTGAIIFFTAGPGEPPQLQDCGGLCWDMGFGSPTGDAGAWIGGRF